eukprot:1295162-Rhodomonas_salina.1
MSFYLACRTDAKTAVAVRVYPVVNIGFSRSETSQNEFLSGMSNRCENRGSASVPGTYPGYPGYPGTRVCIPMSPRYAGTGYPYPGRGVVGTTASFCSVQLRNHYPRYPGTVAFPIGTRVPGVPMAFCWRGNGLSDFVGDYYVLPMERRVHVYPGTPGYLCTRVDLYTGTG